MWIIMLMMMVPALTRKRAQALNSELDGSANVQKPPRKRSHRLSKNVARDSPISNTIIPEVEPIEQQINATVASMVQPSNAPDVVAPVGQQNDAATAPIPQNVQQVVDEVPVNPPKKRGPNTNAKVTKTLKDMPLGSKISLKIDSITMNFVGPSATTFATECGIVIRNVCPLKYHRWDSIPQDDMNVMYEKLQAKFELLRGDKKFMEYVNARLREHWKRYRGELSKHWKSVGGKTNPQLARQKMKPGCRSQDDWDDLCKYWEMEKTQKYSAKMEGNRKKLVNVSRGGSRSIANLVHQMSTPETPPSPLEIYHSLHYKADEKDKEWLNDDARIEYENICKHKKEAIDKLKDEGTTLITKAMEHELERQAIKSVCEKKKSIQSGWEVGVGLVMKKKDRWMKDVVISSQQVDTTSKQDPNEINESRKKDIELEFYKSNYHKMAAFMRQKFPDFDDAIASPDTTEAAGSNEVPTNSDLGC